MAVTTPAAFVRLLTSPAATGFLPELAIHTLTPTWTACQQEDVEAAGAGLGLAEVGSPFWAVVWPGGAALTRYLLDHPWECEGKAVLDFACGSGVSAVAASRVGARRVVANDIDPIALAATAVNAGANAVPTPICLDSRDMLGAWEASPHHDVIVAGDVMYDEDMGRRVLEFLGRWAAAGSRVLLADPGRWALKELVDGGGCTPGGQRLEKVCTYDLPPDVAALSNGLTQASVWALEAAAP